MPYRKPKSIDLTGWLAPWEADVYRRRIDDLLDLLSRIRKAVHDALPDKTDPLELDAAIELALRENTELGKRYDELAKMVDRCMGELEVENERLRAERDTANAAMFGWQNEAEWLRTTMEHALLLIDREHDTKAWDLINDVLEAR